MTRSSARIDGHRNPCQSEWTTPVDIVPLLKRPPKGLTRRCLVSFSGGETSAYMTHWLLKQKPYDEYLVVFANTGQENEATLEFVRQCDEHFGFHTVWI